MKKKIKLNIQDNSKESSSGTDNSTTYKITANAYRKYDSTREHIYNIPDTYAGSDEKMERDERVLNLQTMMFEENQIELPEAVERIFVEISSNSGDNVARSLRHGVDPGEVVINMSREVISVRNGGIPIPVEIHPKEKVWAPQLIFGVLHSSSNYDTSTVRTECGRNGYGAKLTNIFSKQFMVTIGDPNNKRWYRQIWNENMSIRGEPEIKENYDGESFVEIVYKMDFKRFGYEHYPDEAFKLFARHAADMSFTGKVPVSFNGVKFHVQSARDYAKLYLGQDGLQKSILYYQWPAGTETYTKNGVTYSKTKGIFPIVEICAVDTPDNALSVSFANGMWTRSGGVHADAAFNAVTSAALEAVNGGKIAKRKKGRQFKLTGKDVKRHVSMFVSCWVNNPKFDGQTKTALRNPKPKIVIDEKVLQPIMKWQLIARLYAELEAKQFSASKKTDGTKKRYISDLKGEDANRAGTADSVNCTLYATEGKSAMGFAVKMISLYDKGRDYMGLFPMKGKPLNVRNAKPQTVAENDEIIELKKMLGLRENVDYRIEENYKRLRYGHFVVLADSDNDGKHILGLVLNLFHCKYPSLLARGYVKYLRTKIIDVRKKGQVIKFYTNQEYNVWKSQTPDYQTWDHTYFKGLGTSEDADIEEEFKAPRVVLSMYDNFAPNSLELAFSDTLADNRKDWIKDWVPDYSVEDMKIQPISAFINHEFIQYSIADLARSIPRFMDGLKVSQRKIIWGSMKKWGAKVGMPSAAKIKVANLANYISESTGYHHGEKCLCDAIIAMAADYTGTNNLPYFCQNGQFGCVDPKTPILLWSGKKILAKDVKVGHELIGDDGTKRTVSHVVSGVDDMYEITQAHGDSYIVNSIHILTLWDIENNQAVDIPLYEYLRLDLDRKMSLYGYKYMKDSKMSEISVKKIGQGEYCGWHIDGNERFLLGDFTVTHNTRNMLGKDASEPRYSRTRPQWWWNYIFKKDDVNLLEMVMDEGKTREPVTFLPIVPLQMINGAKGIGTGHSTFVPNHDPLNICAWLIAKIKGETLPPIIPWYNNFEGKIELRVRGRKNDDPEDENELSQEYIDKNTRITMDTIGTFEVQGNKRKKIVITELPVGMGMHKYNSWLGKLREEKKITKYDNYCTATKVHFEVYGMKNPSVRNLKLQRSYGLSNMVMLDNNNKPLKYESSYDMIDSFYNLRLPYYELRRQNMIQKIDEKIQWLNNKIRFIKAVIAGHELVKISPNVTIAEANQKECLLVLNKKKTDIIPQLDQLGFDHTLLKKVTLYQCTMEEVQASNDDLENLKKDKAAHEQNTAANLWLSDLEEFVKVYCQKNKCKPYTNKLRINISE